MNMKLQEATEHQIDWTKRKKVPMPHDNQNTKIQNKERILRAAREKAKYHYKGRTIRIIPDSQ